MTQEADDVIISLKDSFSRHGIPQQVFSNNGPCFKSHKMTKFAQAWGFDHDTSSPRYPQSNGLAEVSVKSVKYLLEKCGGDLNSFQKGILILRNSPLKGGKSPAQLLFGRQLKDNLPTLSSNLEKREIVNRDIVADRRKSKQNYDRHVPKQVKNVVDFTTNQRVVVQDDCTKEWTLYGKIHKEVAPRSYQVRLDKGGLLRRNRRFIRKVYGVNLSEESCGDNSIEVEFEINEHHNYDTDSDTVAYDEQWSDSDTVPYE